MSLSTTNELIQSIRDKMNGNVGCLVDRTESVEPWNPPSKLKLDDGTWISEAERFYQEAFSDKVKQNPEIMVNRGNEYYFTAQVVKSYRLYNRSRIENVAIHSALEDGLATEEGFLNKKYIHLGDMATPVQRT